jgi:transposase
MIAAATGVKVLVATKPVDFRKGADGLAALVQEQLRRARFSSSARSGRTV